jgi:carboxypeptidase C (cathepsin A)
MRLAPSLLALLALAWSAVASADGARRAGKEAGERSACGSAAKEEKPVEKRGSVTLGGAEVKYLVQTGTFPVLKDDGTPRANVFFVYYAATDAQGQPLSVTRAAERPITFCFNGGPGAAAVWLHLGGLGPKGIDLSPRARAGDRHPHRR